MTTNNEVFSKSETIRVELKDKEYLSFTDLNTRLVFRGKNLSDRKSREETIKFALRLTTQAVQHILGGSENALFIADDENALIDKFISKTNEALLAREEKTNKIIEELLKINDALESKEAGVLIPESQWDRIINKISEVKTFGYPYLVVDSD